MELSSINGAATGFDFSQIELTFTNLFSTGLLLLMVFELSLLSGQDKATALLGAAENGYPICCQVLLDARADLTAKDSEDCEQRLKACKKLRTPPAGLF
eukprot:3784236-Amphidinium_carterae.1